MECERKNPTEFPKVAVRCEDGQIASRRDSAHQEIGIGSLNAFRAAAVANVRGLLEIRGLEFEIGEGSQLIAYGLELLVSFETREELLADWADDDGPAFPHELRQFLDDWGGHRPGATKRKRPHGRVDQNPHERRRCFL